VCSKSEPLLPKMGDFMAEKQRKAREKKEKAAKEKARAFLLTRISCYSPHRSGETPGKAAGGEKGAPSSCADLPQARGHLSTRLGGSRNAVTSGRKSSGKSTPMAAGRLMRNLKPSPTDRGERERENEEKENRPLAASRAPGPQLHSTAGGVQTRMGHQPGAQGQCYIHSSATP
jgi:hypothetical protein